MGGGYVGIYALRAPAHWLQLQSSNHYFCNFSTLKEALRLAIFYLPVRTLS